MCAALGELAFANLCFRAGSWSCEGVFWRAFMAEDLVIWHPKFWVVLLMMNWLAFL